MDNIDINDIGGLQFEETPYVFLSASVPKRLNSDDYQESDREIVRQEDQNYCAFSYPELIRAAVVAVTREALKRKMKIVFGAHPTISPLMIQAAESTGAPDDSILIFQAKPFESMIPQSTLDLIHNSKGKLIITPTKNNEAIQSLPLGQRKRHPCPESLKYMREQMVNIPRLCCGIFIGGMIGVEDEATLFKQARPNLKCYAIASTGGAAAKIFQNQGFAGNLSSIDRQHLETMRSYTLLARKIFNDI